MQLLCVCGQSVWFILLMPRCDAMPGKTKTTLEECSTWYFLEASDQVKKKTSCQIIVQCIATVATLRENCTCAANYSTTQYWLGQIKTSVYIYTQQIGKPTTFALKIIANRLLTKLAGCSPNPWLDAALHSYNEMLVSFEPKRRGGTIQTYNFLQAGSVRQLFRATIEHGGQDINKNSTLLVFVCPWVLWCSCLRCVENKHWLKHLELHLAHCLRQWWWSTPNPRIDPRIP